ncbi:thioredoxin family protein [Butyricimonas sp.]|uniref:thioredoxin family protein n=1 Tax=Butyricimonas sp. TaxID=1969738 RepID=UPI0025BC52B5|nr:thioredoxin family protein [Butyricimonas sp.]
MKNLFLLFAFMMLGIPSFCQEGVHFQNISFNEALARAKAENKIVFMDCYTSWCGPCKMMLNAVFPQKKAGDYFNEKFICVKYDLERGEGPELAKKYEVRYYPTFMILNPDGSVIHKVVGGSRSVDEFIQRIEESFDENEALSSLNKKYAQGKRDKAFLIKYTESLIKASDLKTSSVIDDLLQVLNDEEKLSPDYWWIFEVVERSPRGSVAGKYLLANREKFMEVQGKKAIERRFYLEYQYIFNLIFSNKIPNKDMKTLNEIEKEVKSLKLENERHLLGLINIAKAITKNDIDHVIATCEQEFPQMNFAQTPKKILEFLYKDKATDAQKARWDALIQKMSK